MDSVSQFALGAAVGVAALGRRVAPWRAALWGGIAGTLPDLDVLVDHGDAVRNMVLHRGASHSLFWLTLFSLPFAAAVVRLHGHTTSRAPRSSSARCLRGEHVSTADRAAPCSAG